MVEWHLEKHIIILEFKAGKDGNNCQWKVRSIGELWVKDWDLGTRKEFHQILTSRRTEKEVTRVLTLKALTSWKKQ